ncbi:MAG: magnesium transporter [Candidatus Binatia bacterium]
MATAKVRAEVLRKLLRAGATGRAGRLIDRLHPADVAEMLPELGPAEVRTVIDILFSAERAGRTLRELPAEALPATLEVLDDQRIADILGRLPPDDAVAFLQALPDERRPRVTERLPGARKHEIDHLLAYPESTAGSVMTTRYLAVRDSMSAQEAIDSIRRHSEEEIEQIFYLYVTDDSGRLRGVVPIRKLVTAPPERPIGELMITDPVSVKATADQEEAAQVVAKYNLLAVPVVDDSSRLLGVITVDDVIDVIKEEATEDMYRMVGLTEEEHIYTPLPTVIRRRLPWMVINLATAFLASWVVGLFEPSIHKVSMLAVFMPIVAGMGGNGGTQTLTVITRGLALGEIELDAALRAMLREIVIGLAIGVVTGMLTALGAYAWRGSAMLGLVLLIAMVLNMVIAGLSGAAVPMLLKALKQDPALGSGVIVTTFTDVFGFLCFLGIATILIQYLA